MKRFKVIVHRQRYEVVEVAAMDRSHAETLAMLNQSLLVFKSDDKLAVMACVESDGIPMTALCDSGTALPSETDGLPTRAF